MPIQAKLPIRYVFELRSLSFAKYGIRCDFEGSAEQRIEFINVSNGLAEHI